MNTAQTVFKKKSTSCIFTQLTQTRDQKKKEMSPQRFRSQPITVKSGKISVCFFSQEIIGCLIVPTTDASGCFVGFQTEQLARSTEEKKKTHSGSYYTNIDFNM